MTRTFSLIVLLGTMLAGCAPSLQDVPNHASIDVPPQWLEDVPEIGHIEKKWWRNFGDTRLDVLEDKALAGNVDILMAIQRIEESRANIALARSQYLPQVNGSVDAARSRSFQAGRIVEATVIQPEALLSWQLDLFGRYSSQKQAAIYSYEASRIDRDGIALAVSSQLAQAYFGLLALDAQLTVTRETVKARLVQLNQQRDKTESGYNSQFELTQAQSEYDAVRQMVPDLERSIRAQELAITVLTGETPGHVVGRGDIREIDLPQVPASLPSHLLRRRPDLASAEYRIAAADATLASRRAQFLPQVTLSASGGAFLINSMNYDPLSLWSIGASILQPIFQGGRLTAQVDVATARRNQAAYDYKSNVLQAFSEVLTGLNAIDHYCSGIGIARSRRDTLIWSLRIARDRYANGYTDYLEVLDAQRALYATELSAIALHRDQLNNNVQLTAALGGGWDFGDVKRTPQSQVNGIQTQMRVSADE